MNINDARVTLRIDHEFKELIPPLSNDEYEGLRDSILEEGCRNPIIVHDGVIIDGHNRYDICQLFNVPFKTSPFPKENPSRDDL